MDGATRPKAAGFSARSARTTSTGCVTGSAKSGGRRGTLLTLRPDLARCGDGKTVKAETDDTFVFTLEFRDGGIATMIASFAATPARGARLAVMGDAGTLIAEQPGPNPMEDGVVVASRNGSPLQPLPTPRATRRSPTRAITG